jgi:outer membrane immunogenic protein
MKITQIFAAVLFFLLGASQAYAGGALTDYTSPPPARACGGAYSGFYAGGALGFGGLSSKVSGGGGSLTSNDRGFTIGGLTGYNWQCNGGLLGIETDINYFNADATSGVACCGASESFGSEINWFGTLRGRVGIVGDENFLVFATAGLAYGGIDHSLNYQGPPVGSFSQSNSNTEVGWTAGGGVEYLLSDTWAFRADASYVDFGSQDETFTDNTCGSGTCTLRASYDDNFWVARVGLTYLFGATPEPEPVVYAPPLK